MDNLAFYLRSIIRDMMGRACRNLAGNPREALFALRMTRRFRQSERVRARIAKAEGLEVPPSLIASIAVDCNLRCQGCYARASGLATDGCATHHRMLTAAQWHAIFEEAATLGVNFALLAGGEPLTRRDVLEAVAGVDDMLFPVFTNGTLLDDSYADFFARRLNLIPIFSIEGNADGTDARRGAGVYAQVREAMRRLADRQLFFGVSITVTTANYHAVTAPAFIDDLQAMGCKSVVYVEYVPVVPGTDTLALRETHATELARILDARRNAFADLILLSFPGDEKELGGCLASGRGFFHIAPDGSAEPCPFASHSDSNVLQLGLRGTLRSPLFRRLREATRTDWSHTGGCTLFEHRAAIQTWLTSPPAEHA